MPSDVRFAVVRKMLEQHGWWLDRIRGSHHHFRHATAPPVGIPVHRGKVKYAYVRQVEKAISEVQEQDQG